LNAFVLGYVGAMVAEQPYVIISQLATGYYFAFFFVIVPVLSRLEKAKPLPKSIYEAVVKKAAIVLMVGTLAMVCFSHSALAAKDAPTPPETEWSFDGMFGTYDKAAMQRGFQVYREVCAACHGIERVAYRNLMDLGYSEAQVKAIAAEAMVTDGPNDEGEMFQRPATPADRIYGPYPNDQAARYANNGVLPPDMSLIVKARKYGADYINALLTGYKEPPEGVTLSTGMYYNKYYAGNLIAMPQPFMDGQVTYADGTESTVEQMSYDVTTFLAWASEPTQDDRKRMGWKVLNFMVFFSFLLYLVKKKIWRDVKE
jgi:ubiquinol-cytochrome c reductase cytochrome b/c1 subunit